MSPDLLSAVPDTPLDAVSRRQWQFSDIPGFLHAAREVVKSLRQHELAQNPVTNGSLGYLGGAKNVSMVGG